MRKLSFFALALLAGVTACQKSAPGVEPLSEPQPDAALTVNIGMENEDVKATTAQVKDFQINKVQVFVFDASSKLETSF